jgi:hypothetical protein
MLKLWKAMKKSIRRNNRKKSIIAINKYLGKNILRKKEREYYQEQLDQAINQPM